MCAGCGPYPHPHPGTDARRVDANGRGAQNASSGMDLLLSTIVVSLAALAACGGIALPVSGTDASSACRTGDACDAGCPTGACQIDAGTALGDSGPASQCDGCPADGSSAVDAHSEASPPDPCGEIGHDDCGACAGPCANGRCLVTLASGQSYPQGIAVGTESVYWANNGSWVLMRVPIAGGTPETLDSNLWSTSAIAWYESNIYWAGGSGVRRAAPDGSSAVTLIPGLGGDAIVVNATGIYLEQTTRSPLAGDPCDGWVSMTSLDGGVLTPLVSNACTGWGIAVDATGVVYIDEIEPSPPVLKLPVGASPTYLVPSTDSELAVGGLAIDSTSVYWADWVDGAMLRVGLDGGTPDTIASDQPKPQGVVVDATAVYWVNLGDQSASPPTKGSVVKFPLRAGCAPVTLAAGLASPGRIAIDAASVYWTDYSGGTVMKTSK